MNGWMNNPTQAISVTCDEFRAAGVIHVVDQGAREQGDSELMAAAQAGDVDAFAVLMRRHYAACLRYAARMLGNQADAEDAVQETFIRAYRSRHRYRETERYRAWVFRILRNRCRTLITRRSARLDVALKFVGLSSTTVSPAVSDGTMDEVQRALALLPVVLREAFVLKFVEQLDYNEMSAISGASVSALKMRVQRARETLKEVLDDK
jgi:RNA polymerase sigma-70 factor (ECF subfamily)